MNDKDNKKLIILCAGGTGGHFFPAKALASDLLERGYRVHFFTDHRGEKYLKQLEDEIEYSIIRSGTLGKGIFGKISGAMSLITGISQSLIKVKKLKPSVVVGFGGYPSFPGVFAAQKLGIKTIIHEQNAVVGKANAMLAKKAYRIALSLPVEKGLDTAEEVRSIITGNPVRQDIIDLFAKPYSPHNENDAFNLFVVGGSLGAQVFADIIPQAISELSETKRQKINIVQQCREENLEAVKLEYSKIGIQAYLASFFENIASEYQKAHLVIARAGASSVAEVAVAGRPTIFVPMKHDDQQQKFNAKSLVEKGGAWLLEERENFTPEGLAELLEELMNSPQKLFNAADAIRDCARADATRKLGNVVAAVAQGWDKQDDPTLSMIGGNE